MFTPEERLIFPYFDGAKDRFGDPVAIDRRLTIACGGDWADLVRKALPEETPQEAATIVMSHVERLFAAVRSAFEMVPFDSQTGTGALDANVYEAIRSFIEFTVKKKKSSVR